MSLHHTNARPFSPHRGGSVLRGQPQGIQDAAHDLRLGRSVQGSVRHEVQLCSGGKDGTCMSRARALRTMLTEAGLHLYPRNHRNTINCNTPRQTPCPITTHPLRCGAIGGWQSRQEYDHGSPGAVKLQHVGGAQLAHAAQRQRLQGISASARQPRLDQS